MSVLIVYQPCLVCAYISRSTDSSIAPGGEILSGMWTIPFSLQSATQREERENKELFFPIESSFSSQQRNVIKEQRKDGFEEDQSILLRIMLG